MKIYGACHCGKIAFEAEVDPNAAHTPRFWHLVGFFSKLETRVRSELISNWQATLTPRLGTEKVEQTRDRALGARSLVTRYGFYFLTFAVLVRAADLCVANY